VYGKSPQRALSDPPDLIHWVLSFPTTERKLFGLRFGFLIHNKKDQRIAASWIAPFIPEKVMSQSVWDKLTPAEEKIVPKTENDPNYKYLMSFRNGIACRMSGDECIYHSLARHVIEILKNSREICYLFCSCSRSGGYLSSSSSWI
jgi:hypothetical protein